MSIVAGCQQKATKFAISEVAEARDLPTVIDAEGPHEKQG
jgi:hypothetical protein